MKITIILVVSIFLLTFVSISSLSAQSFASEGTWEVGGNVSYTSATSVRNGETSENSLGVFSLDVPFYYFVIDGLELGIIPSYQNFSSGGSSTSSPGPLRLVGIFAKYRGWGTGSSRPGRRVLIAIPITF